MNVPKDSDTGALLKDGQKLLKWAKEQNLAHNIVLFLENMEKQLVQLNNAQTQVEEMKAKTKAKAFTSGKYKLKEMKKLRAKESKKFAMKTFTIEQFEKQYKGTKAGKDTKGDKKQGKRTQQEDLVFFKNKNCSRRMLEGGRSSSS